MIIISRRYEGVELSEIFQIGVTSRNIEPVNLPAEEVAEILGVNEMQLSRWRDSGYFKAETQDHEHCYWYSAQKVYELKARRDAEQKAAQLKIGGNNMVDFPSDEGKKNTADTPQNNSETNKYNENCSTNSGLGKEGSEKPAQIYGKPIFGLITITSADVAKIAAMSAQEKIALKVKINQLDLRRVFGVDRQHKGFICPVCGNGSGRSGDGIVAQIDYDKNGNWYYWHKCFTCDDFNGKLTNILDKITGKNFNQTIAIGAKMLELAESSNFEVSALPPADDDLTDEQKAELETMIREDIQNAPNFIEQLPASDRRDLTLATLKHFGCGYLPQWIHPKNRVLGKNIKPTRRIIIPSGLNSYNAVMLKTDRTPANKKYWKMKAGEQAIFNAGAICAGEEIIIVEGEIDAMSIWQATNLNVVAIGSASNWKNFIGYVNEKFSDEEKISCNFIVLLDNDAAGRDNAQKFVDALKAEGYPAAAIFLSDSDEKVDANDILSESGAGILKAALDSKLSAIRGELSAARDEFKKRQAEKELKQKKLQQHTAQIEKIENLISKAELKIEAKKNWATTYLDALKDFSSDTVYSVKTIRAAAICSLYDVRTYGAFKEKLRQNKISVRYVEKCVNISAEKINGYIKRAENLWDTLNVAYSQREELQEQIDNPAAFEPPPPVDVIGEIFGDKRNFKLPFGFSMECNRLACPPRDAIASRPFYVSNLYRRNDGTFCADVTTLDGAGIPLTVRQIPKGTLADARKIAPLANDGLPFTSNYSAAIVDYIDAFISANSQILQTIPLYEKLGWVEINNKQIFVSPYSDQFVIDKNNELLKHLRVKGDFESWLAIVKKVFDTSLVGRIIFGAALASVILKIIGCRTFVLHIRSKSKAGKSACFKLAASIFGDEDFLKSFNSTANALIGDIEKFSPFPCIIDERQAADANFDESRFVYRAGLGQGRGRCNKDGTLQYIQKWLSVIICNGEQSLTETAQTQGVHTRAIELNFKGDKILPDDLAREIHLMFNAQNIFGYGGKIFLEKLQLENQAELSEAYKLIGNTLRECHRDYINDHYDFIAAIATALILARKYFFNATDADAFDAALNDATEFFTLIDTQTNLSDEEAEKDFILAWIAENRLHFEDMPVERKGERLMTPIFGKKAGGSLYIFKKSLEDALTRAGYSPSKVISEMFAVGLFEKIDGKPTKVIKDGAIPTRALKLSAEFFAQM